MSDDGRRQNQSDPTAERTSEQSTQTNSGLGSGAQGPDVGSEREPDDPLNRQSGEQYETPRRYEEGDTDPAVPGNEPTLRIDI